jgi:hypothetical protein
VIKLTEVIIEGYHCYQLHTTFYNILLSRLSPYVEIIGDHQCGFRCNRLALIRFFAFPTESYMHSSSPPFVLNAPPISSSSITWETWT